MTESETIQKFLVPEEEEEEAAGPNPFADLTPETLQNGREMKAQKYVRDVLLEASAIGCDGAHISIGWEVAECHRAKMIGQLRAAGLQVTDGRRSFLVRWKTPEGAAAADAAEAAAADAAAAASSPSSGWGISWLFCGC